MIVSTDVVTNDIGTGLSLVEPGTPEHGEAFIINGELVYQASEDFEGTDCFQYTVACDNGAVSNAEICVNVTKNLAPVIRPDMSEMTQETGTGGELVLCLDASDPEGDALIYNIVQVPAMGELSLDNDNCLVYVAGDESGSDSVIIEVCDEFGNCDQMQIDILLTSQNLAPYFVDENGEQLNGSIGFNIETNTSLEETCLDAVDPNGDEVAINIVDSPINGTIVMNGNCLTYTPSEDFIGTDIATFEVCDESGACSSIQVELDVTDKVNQAPQAADDNFTVSQDEQSALTVIDNDSDPEEDEITIVEIITAPENGTASIEGDQIVYTPAEGYVGSDALQYVITDINGNTDTAWVFIRVEESDEEVVAIEAIPDQAEADAGASVIIDVLSNDTPDGLMQKVIQLRQPFKC